MPAPSRFLPIPRIGEVQCESLTKCKIIISVSCCVFILSPKVQTHMKTDSLYPTLLVESNSDPKTRKFNFKNMIMAPWFQQDDNFS